MDLRMNTIQYSRRRLGVALTLAWLAYAANLPVHAIQLSPPAAYSANETIDDDIWYVNEQRKRFLRAESALRKRDMPRFLRLRDELENYPLYPYLEFADLSRRLGSTRDDEIEAFLARYSDTPLAWRLRGTWLKLLARRGHWEKFLDVYEQSNDATMRCQWLRALINTDQADKAMPYVETLWLVGRSQPPACDPVFAAWRSTGKLTRELVLRRIELAIRNGRPSLAAYLIRSLDSDQQPLAKQWLRVREKPTRVMQVAPMDGDRDDVEAILVYGIERMARRDPEQAATTWKSLRTRFAFSASAVATLHRRIGLAYAFAHRVEALYWLNAIPESRMDERAREWRILISMQYGEWRQALDYLLAIEHGGNAAGPSSQRWRYWTARALESLDWPEDADTIYAELARERSYYGFLAADRIERDYQFKHRSLEYSSREMRLLEAQPGAMRARELFSLGRTVDARREWRMFTQGMNDEALARAAKLAQGWGWHGRAILTVARTPHLDDLEMRFPLAYRGRVLAQAQARDLDPAWIYAIVRQESAFMADARSPAGALGLMQIMPGTGRRIGRRLDKPLNNRRQLLDADVSLEFGSTYLRTLLDQLDGHPVLAAAAYNAGIHRVERWRPAERNMPADLWIENIPYRETREYVRRVTAYTAIYQQRLGRKTVRVSARLTPIPSRATRLAQAEIADASSAR
jgi:soluble lytic murein transglycosylase